MRVPDLKTAGVFRESDVLAMFRQVSGYKPPPYRYRVRPSAVKRIGVVAIDVVEEAFTIANRDPLEPQVLHRLAFGFLMLTGRAAPGAVSDAWAILRHEGIFSLMSCRQSHFGVLMDGIRSRIDKLDAD